MRDKNVYNMTIYDQMWSNITKYDQISNQNLLPKFQFLIQKINFGEKRFPLKTLLNWLNLNLWSESYVVLVQYQDYYPPSLASAL